MSAYLDAIDARRERTTQIFALYNERRFDELLAFYTDDVVSFMPHLLPDAPPGTRYANGKTEYLAQLREFREIYGTITVTAVFAAGLDTDIQIEDAQGNFGSFAVNLTDGGLIKRIFFLHRAARQKPPAE